MPFPGVGHTRPDLTSRPMRFILVHDSLIAYAPETKPLWVIAVIHGRRNPRDRRHSQRPEAIPRRVYVRKGKTLDLMLGGKQKTLA